MARLRRVLLRVSGPVTVAILVLVAGAWIRSYRTGDFLLCPMPFTIRGVSAFYVATGRGGTSLGAIDTHKPTFKWEHGASPRYGNGGWSWATEKFGFDAGVSYLRPANIYTYAMVVPDSFLFLLALGAAGWRVWPGPLIQRRRKHRLENSCRKCGYCLTGNVSGTCPECGQTIH